VYVSRCWGRVGGESPGPITSGDGATGRVKLMLIRFRPVLGGARPELSSDDCEKDESARVRAVGVLDCTTVACVAGLKPGPWIRGGVCVCVRSLGLELTTGRSEDRGDRSDLGAGDTGDLMGASSSSVSSSDDVASCFSADIVVAGLCRLTSGVRDDDLLLARVGSCRVV
jgi:hypothetical protein